MDRKVSCATRAEDILVLRMVREDTNQGEGILLMGELFQNNHHFAKLDPNFAKKWYELDFTYVIMKGLHAVRIIRLKPILVEQTVE